MNTPHPPTAELTAEPTERFDRMLERLKRSTKPESKTLVALFEKNRKRVAEHYESCVPASDGSDWMKWTPKLCPIQEVHGPMFHKGFRQADICPTSRDDIAIWKLLSSGDTDFWDAHHHSLEQQ